MANPPSVLYVELVMSIDRIGDAARESEPIEGEWPPAVVVAHLGDVDEQVWHARIDAMVDAFESGAATPEFANWEPDPVATYDRYRDWSVDDAVARAMAARIAFVTRLRDLSPEQFAGIRGQHEVFGTMDTHAVVMAVLTHDEEHRASLLRVPGPA
ncbi:MAG TPA: DinB family protein [Candidatus Nanopelagicales bacterium]|nr:DinB family protein [Candidatus Nanopelagicales bacterium]